MENNRIRVLMIAPLLPPEYAGGGAQAMALGQKLIQRGVEVIGLAGTNTKGSSSVYEVVLGEVRTYRVYRPKDASLFTNVIYLLRFLITLFRLALRVDIVHFHGIRLYPFLGVPITKLLRKQTVGKISLMGTDDPVSLASGLLGSIKIAILRNLDMWIALTEEARDTCLMVGIYPNHIRIVPNGVDCDKFYPLSNPEKKSLRAKTNTDDSLCIVFAGIVSYRKGVDLLIETIPQVLTKHSDVKFLIVGPNTIIENQKVDSELSDKLRSLGPRVILTGFVDDSSDYIRSADVFVLPSRKEGLSNALLEAMSSGLPIVVTNHPWLSDVGIPGTHFLDFMVGSSDDLLEKLESLITNSAVRHELSNATRIRINEGFCLKRIANRYIKLYSYLRKRNSLTQINNTTT